MVVVGLFDDEDKSEVLLHGFEHKELVLLVEEGELDDCGLISLFGVFVVAVEKGYVYKNIEHFRADLVFGWVDHLLVIMGDVELGDEIE